MNRLNWLWKCLRRLGCTVLGNFNLSTAEISTGRIVVQFQIQYNNAIGIAHLNLVLNEPTIAIIDFKLWPIAKVYVYLILPYKGKFRLV